MEENLRLDFDNLNRWFLRNDLFISSGKTFSLDLSTSHRKFLSNDIFIHSENCSPNGDCKISCFKVTKVTEAVYLGLGVDSCGKHDYHINLLINKLRKMIPFFYKIKSLLNEKNKLIVYDAMVTSHLRYGIEVYGFAPLYQIDRLQKIQNKIVKVLFSKSTQYKSSAQLLEEHNILNVIKLRDYCNKTSKLLQY